MDQSRVYDAMASAVEYEEVANRYKTSAENLKV
jgi:hypothetical protein